MLQVPVLLGGLEQRLRQRQPGVVDDEVDAAEREHGRVDRGLHAVGVGDVRGDADRDIRAAQLGRGGLRLLEVEVGDDDARAFGGEAGRDGLADAGCRAGDERDAALVGLRLRHPLQLRLFERPVLDAELLGVRDRGVGRERLGAAHHVDRVEVELAGDAGGLLVRAVA